MPVTTLDPKTALVVIDLQKGILGLPTAHPTNEVVKQARELAEHSAGMDCRWCWSTLTAERPAEQNRRGVLETSLPGGPTWSRN